MGRAFLGLTVVAATQAQEVELALTDAAADRFAALALRCVRQEYPNKLDHVMNGAGEVKSPKALHPAFYGCFDWHSSVHGHWMLVKLLREHPGMARATEIRAVLDENLSPERIALEVAYLGEDNRRSFERTYGWAWLLKLSAELRTWDDSSARRWAEALQPLADELTGRFMTFLPKQTYPIRTGVHPNTAFSLDLALDYARATRDARFEALIRERARDWFGLDRRGPLAWEPGGEDFLSPCLEEAALMSRLLPAPSFRRWLDGFLPGLSGGLVPAVVSDRTDPKIVHLDGLNLSRARALRRIAAALGAADARSAGLLRLADRHARASLPHLASGNYEGEHWLATFAVRMLAER
ncbi:MAG: DUF2891 domain-containing protein [Geothrix sp.]|uniref:DUF2891 domain-containing protein n=1 Tax=Geothrix sp. TaxID=1962974 RepID=UPI0017FE5974|nr:DUF2891 domain-containing protein [Geothrix sp.]NWJ42296.1 DUF2891 domain-containing protein [Geothrix sp.]WIL19737.1 MAG: DUF2891 domain-containing protein [Geothrix sp.]